MENNDLLYYEPQASVQPKPQQISIAQAVKAMVFGLVALTLSELPFFGLLILPPFAIIALCMVKDFKARFPGRASGFLKAAKISAIISMPLSVVTSLFYVLIAVAESAVSYYC